MTLTGTWFDHILSIMQSDDVHHPSFLQVIIFAGASENEISLSPEIQDCMRKLQIACINRLAVYKDLFLKTVMRSTELKGLLILPISNVQPNYRDNPPPEPTVQEGFDQLFVPSILGAPDIVVPLGEVPYFSKVSAREDYLPVGLDIVGLPHSDQSLLKTIQGCLASSSRPLRVSTGARIFDSEGMKTDIYDSPID